MKRKEKIELIKATREQISEHQQKCDELYQHLVKQLALIEHTNEESHMFDLMFNYPNQDEFEERLKRWLKDNK